MQATELHPLHKQLGAKIIECKDGKLYGYKITAYNGLEPAGIELEATAERPERPLSWDGAYDLLYGPPAAPDFTSVLNI